MIEENSAIARRDRQFQSKGMVVKKHQYKEHSYIVEVFTESFGRISLMAQGVRKQKNKFLGLFESLNEIDLTMHKKESSEFYILKSASLIKNHSTGRKRDETLILYAALELYRNIILSEDEYPEFYKLLINFCDYLQKIEKNYILIFWRFFIRIFINFGVHLTLEKCCLCGQKKESYSGYSLLNHGLVCTDCYDERIDSIIEISRSSGRIFNEMHRIGKLVNQIKLEKKVVREINRVLYLHLEEHFHKKIKLNSLILYETGFPYVS